MTIEDTLFDTEDKRSMAVTAFTDLQNHPGWKLFTAIINANIEFLSKCLVEDDFDSPEEIKSIQFMLKAYKNAKNIPQDRITNFTPSTDEVEPNVESFQTIEQFRAELRKTRKTA
jgi:hypothetical protein